MKNLVKNVKANIKIAGAYVKVSFASQLEYKAGFIAWIIANPLQYLVGLLTINVLILNFGGLAGWNSGEIAFFYGLGGLSHGIAVILFSHTWDIGIQVTEGKFDSLLLRPCNVFFQFCFSDFNLVGITDLVPAIPVFVYGCYMVGFKWTGETILALTLFVIGGVMIRGGIFTIIGSIGFFTYRTRRLIGVMLTLSEKGVQYPLAIFPAAVQFIFTFLIPIGFMGFYPATALLGKDLTIGMPGGIMLWTLVLGAIFSLLGYLFFHIGLKRYDSAGS